MTFVERELDFLWGALNDGIGNGSIVDTSKARRLMDMLMAERSRLQLKGGDSS